MDIAWLTALIVEAVATQPSVVALRQTTPDVTDAVVNDVALCVQRVLEATAAPVGVIRMH